MIGLGEKLFEFYIGPMIGGATENWFAYMLALTFLTYSGHKACLVRKL